MISNFLKKYCLTLVAVFVIGGTAMAGGLEVHHHWNFEIGKYSFVVSEMENMRKPGVRFTRVQIRSRTRTHGRDFQCGIRMFSAAAILIPVVGVVGCVTLMQRRQRNGE